ncbi:MAG TPA: hypothetical protein VKT77_17545 [Chthonomonadaceae bacterium]|nr:hypothetical protein [Chthonomonadaceae bacterium]
MKIRSTSFALAALAIAAAGVLLVTNRAGARSHAGRLNAGQESQAPTGVSWQLSEAPQMQMGVRDKFGTLGGYDATFTVTSARGEHTRKTVHVRGDEFKYVLFPENFPNYIEEKGRFSWTCTVRGRVVVHGAFSYIQLPRGGTELVVPRNY